MHAYAQSSHFEAHPFMLHLTASASEAIIYFFIYAMLGWVCEVLYCLAIDKKLTNRGFLNGPYCPIYGFGALIILKLLTPLQSSPAILFFASIISCSVLEYITSVVMEKFFHMRWWDYSHYKFNINGRVCLLNSVLFGVLGLVMIYLIHPCTAKLVQHIPMLVLPAIASLILIGMSIDFIFSARSLLLASSQLAEIKARFEQFKIEQTAKGVQLIENVEETIRQLHAKHASGEQASCARLLLEKLQEINLKNRKLRQMLQNENHMALKHLTLPLHLLKADIETLREETRTKAQPQSTDPNTDK